MIEELERLGVTEKFDMNYDTWSIMYKWDWCASISLSNNEAFKYEITIFGPPKITKEKSSDPYCYPTGDYVATIHLVDDDELLKWLQLVNYDVAKLHPHNVLKEAYVKHRKWNHDLGLMIKTSETVDIKKLEQCELMIADCESWEGGGIIMADSTDVVPSTVKFPLPLSMGSVNRSDLPGPAKRENVKACQPEFCLIGLNTNSLITYEKEFLENSKRAFSDHEDSSASLKLIGSMGWFEHCPTCGSQIFKGHIQSRAAKYREEYEKSREEAVSSSDDEMAPSEE